MSGDPYQVRVRVRGPYATAITKLLLDAGLRVVQATPPIQSRFSIPFVAEPADVTVKSDESDPRVLVVVGEPRAVGTVVELVASRTGPLYVEKSILDQFSTIGVTITGRINGECRASFRGIEVVLEAQADCVPGKVVSAVVLSPLFSADQPARCRKGFALYRGLYTLFSWEHVSVSEHIADRGLREKLMEASGIALRNGFGVRWSSNSAFAPLDELVRTLAEDVEVMKRLLSTHVEGGRELSGGRGVARLVVNTHSALAMDSLRAAVTPTVRGHHVLKVEGRELEVLIDFAEALVPSVGVVVEDHLVEHVLSKLQERRRVFFKHAKLDGRVTTLGPFSLKKRSGRTLLLERTIVSHGVYDGLNVKKEPGDLALTVTSYLSNVITHAYYSKDGALKGVYVNVNTPVFITHEGPVYNDLEVDVVCQRGVEARVVDSNELMRLVEAGRLKGDAYREVLSYAEELTARVRKAMRLVEEGDVLGFYEVVARPESQPELFRREVDIAMEKASDLARRR